MSDLMDHMPHLRDVAMQDVAAIEQKEDTYKGSWRRGGGVNAWHMARRKIDRLQTMLAPPSASDVQNLKDFANNVHRAGDDVDSKDDLCYVQFHTHPKIMAKLLMQFVNGEDIFVAMDSNTTGEDGTVLAEVRDLRRYLMLFEARLLALNTELRSDVQVEMPFAILEPKQSWQPVGFESDLIQNTLSRSIKVTLLQDSERLVPRAVSSPVPAEDSNKYAERECTAGFKALGLSDICANCGGTRASHRQE